MAVFHIASVGICCICFFVVETSCSMYRKSQAYYSVNEDYIRLTVSHSGRFKRAEPLRKGCPFAFNRSEIIKPLNTEFTDPHTPCLKWKCYRSGRLGLLRFKSGCLFKGRCILWNPYKPDVEKTGLECDERLCRIHWTNGILQYGMVSPLEQSHCHYNGTCYPYGEVINFVENCTTAVCDVLPKFRRWMRRPLWKPTSAGCLSNGECNANGTMFTFGQCLQYMCQATVNITQTKINDTIHFHFQAVSELKPMAEGCIRHTGGCVNVNESYEAADCVTLKCVQQNNQHLLKVDREGCLHKSGCVNVSVTHTERCSSRTCNKKRVDNSIDYFFETQKATGCPNYFTPEDPKCYKKGETVTSTEAYGKAKGCPGAVVWKCDPQAKTIKPNCKGTR